MHSWLFTIIVYAIGAFICYVFFSRVSEKKLNTPLCLLIGFIIFELGGASCNLIFNNSYLINTAMTAIINMLFGIICFRVSKIEALFYAMLLDAFSSSIENMVIFTLSAVLKVPTTVYNENPFMLVSMFILSKSIYLASVIVISRLVKKDANKVKIPLSFYIFPTSTFIAMTVFWYICMQDAISDRSKIIFAGSCVLLFISTIVLFITYRKNVEKENKFITLENEIAKIKTETTYYDLLKEKNEQLMIYAHDAKNHLTAIKNLNNNEEIAEYIDRMTESLTNYSNVCHSSNKMIDAIVNRYITECEMKHIDFAYDVKLCDLSYIDNTDIVAILSNLMNNAVESAEKADRGFISFAIDRRNRFEVLVIKNTCTEKPDKKNGMYLSSKNDKENHGLGLRSITQTVQKYGGDFYNEYDEDKKIFISTVIVRRPTTDETEDQ